MQEIVISFLVFFSGAFFGTALGSLLGEYLIVRYISGHSSRFRRKAKIVR